MTITPQQLKDACQRLGYTLKSEGITTFGIRNNDMTAGIFNDWLGIYYISGGKEIITLDTGTVDPGSYYIEHPMNPDGCAVMKFGQYKDSYCKGQHKGYNALVQCKKIDFYRITKVQFELDNKGVQRGKWLINLKGKEIYNQLIGANQHRASAYNMLEEIGAYSAGCQVRNNPREYNTFIDTCWKSPQKYFDYILFSQNDLI